MASNVTIVKATGLNTQPNELALPPGSLAVAENVEITRDDIIEVSRGFEDFSSNLPDFTPAQLISVGGVAYLHLDNGIWYHNGTNWLRKRGTLGTALSNPVFGVVVSGHFYVTTTDHVVYDINLSTGSRTILAGRFGVAAHTDDTGAAARFSSPYGITTDGTNLYVTESANHCVRQIVISTGVVTTLCGTSGTTSGHTDSATPGNVRFNSPAGIVRDGAYLYVTEQANHCVRKVVIATGETTTLCGTSGTTSGHTDSATPGNVRFNTPIGIASDGTYLYVVEFVNHCVRKVVIATGETTTPAGTTGTTAGHTDDTGNAARFNAPHGIEIISGVAYIADFSNNCIRKLVLSTNVVTTLAGTATGTTSGFTDGIGTASRFKGPSGIHSDGTDLLICDNDNHTIRKLYLAQTYVATIDGLQDQLSGGFTAASTGLPYSGGIIVGPS